MAGVCRRRDGLFKYLTVQYIPMRVWKHDVVLGGIGICPEG